MCVCRGVGDNTARYILYLLLTKTWYNQSGLARWKIKLHFKAFSGLSNADVILKKVRFYFLKSTLSF